MQVVAGAAPRDGAAGPRWLGGLLAIAGGLAQTASLAPLSWWPLQILGIALLVIALQQAEGVRRSAGLGWLFGVSWLGSGLWWLYISLHDFGGMAAPLAALAVAVLAAALSLYYALAAASWAWLTRSAARRTPAARMAAAAAFAACWTLAELARGAWFTGFPWGAGGYAHTTGLLAFWAPWIGVYGIGALAAWIGACLGLTFPFAGRAAVGLLVPPLLVISLGAALPHTFTRSTGSVTVSLLQTNVPQDLKFDPAEAAINLAALIENLESAKGRIVVTPESALPVPLSFMPAAQWATVVASFRTGERAALIGTFLGNDEVGYMNSMVGVLPGQDAAPQALYSYGKRHLLPFGEFVPIGFKWFVALMNIPLGDQEHGQSEALFDVAGQRLRPLICYEDLFGEDFVGSVLGAESATVLVNASNLAWFGHRMVQDQHLQFSRMRALEFQRPVIRATNTGATAVVDHQGRVGARLPALVRRTLEASVEGRRGDTPYARWLVWAGLWPLWLACFGLLGAIVLRRRLG